MEQKKLIEFRNIVKNFDGQIVLKGVNLDSLKELLKGKTTTVAGPSGVGKSSLINQLQDDVYMEIGSISEKIERGKHTTRHSEIISLI